MMAFVVALRNISEARAEKGFTATVQPKHLRGFQLPQLGERPDSSNFGIVSKTPTFLGEVSGLQKRASQPHKQSMNQINSMAADFARSVEVVFRPSKAPLGKTISICHVAVGDLWAGAGGATQSFAVETGTQG